MLARECEDLNLIFNHWIIKKTPFFALKIATTIDGYVAAENGHSQWITGELSRKDVMRWRCLFPSIAVGAGTVLQDNPRLTSRINDSEWCPWRFVFDRSLKTVTQSPFQLYCDHFHKHTIVVTTHEAPKDKIARLDQSGVCIWQLPHTDEKVFFENFRARCAQEGITGVLFEGGPTLSSNLLKHRQLDYLLAYRAPKILGDRKALSVFSGFEKAQLSSAITLEQVRHCVYGNDQLMRGFIRYP